MKTQDHLTLSPEQMRELGYRVVDMLVDHFEHLPEKPVTRRASRGELEGSLRELLPVQGMDTSELLDEVRQCVFENTMHVDHPRFFAFVPSPSNFVSAMADALASGFNVFAGTWLEASGPTQIELVTVDWLRQACGLPDSAGGLFVSGGSMANLTALAVARHVMLGDRFERAVVYCSDQTHSSIDRGLRVLGFHQHQLHRIASDAAFRLDMKAFRRAVESDRQRGLVPFCLVANAGTTNSGAIDPLPALADYCQHEGLWLHADGAYGAAAVFCEWGKQELRGLELVDSLALDPHKWLFQPFEIGCILVRRSDWLRETFHILPEYLADIEGRAGEVNLCDYGVQLTRGFRALKLWMSLKFFGRAAFEAAQHRGFALAELAETTVERLPHWEVVSPAQLGIVTFRYAPQGVPFDSIDRLNHGLVAAVIQDGYAMLSSTVLRGMTVLRMCCINPRTTEQDVVETLERLDRMAKGLIAY